MSSPENRNPPRMFRIIGTIDTGESDSRISYAVFCLKKQTHVAGAVGAVRLLVRPGALRALPPGRRFRRVHGHRALHPAPLRGPPPTPPAAGAAAAVRLHAGRLSAITGGHKNTGGPPRRVLPRRRRARGGRIR